MNKDGPINKSAQWQHLSDNASELEQRLMNNMELQAEELYEIKLLLASHLMVKASDSGGHQRTVSREKGKQVVQGGQDQSRV